MTSKCCSPEGPRKLRVGGRGVSVVGLDQLFERAFEEGRRPGQRDLPANLLAALRAAGNYIPPHAEDGYAEAVAIAFRDYFDAHRPAMEGVRGGTVKIEILGPGCARCRATEENVRKALAETGLEAEIVHVTDLLEISKRRVMLTPGVMIDGQLRSSGRVPEIGEIKDWLAAVAK